MRLNRKKCVMSVIHILVLYCFLLFSIRTSNFQTSQYENPGHQAGRIQRAMRCQESCFIHDLYSEPFSFVKLCTQVLYLPWLPCLLTCCLIPVSCTSCRRCMIFLVLTTTLLLGQNLTSPINLCPLLISVVNNASKFYWHPFS